MGTPQYINEVLSDVRCIKAGWYAMDDVGNLSSGPFSSHAECFGSIIQPVFGPLQTIINKRINVMTNMTIGLEKTEGEIFAFEVSDEALEIAAVAAKEKANFTLGACTGLSECPG
jgi:hypothetical protein